MKFKGRDTRQKGIIPPTVLAESQVLVVGVGAIGRQVAIQLAAMGVGNLTLCDFDSVDEVNLAPQGFLEADIGRIKVEAVGEMCHKMNSEINIACVADKYLPKYAKEAMFLCVDSISTRRVIVNMLPERVRFVVDTRMAAEALRVFAMVRDEAPFMRRYEGTLFEPAEAHDGGCTTKSTIYCANVAAGIAIAQYRKYLTGMPVDFNVGLNLLAMEMEVSDVQ